MNVTFDEPPPVPERSEEERRGFVMKLAMKTGLAKNREQAHKMLIGVLLGAVILTAIVWFF